LIEEPMAAAIGVGLPVQDPAGNMIIDIGGGTTEVALISLSGRSFSAAACASPVTNWTKQSWQYMKRAYNLMVGERTAEEIKIKIGSAYPPKGNKCRSERARSGGGAAETLANHFGRKFEKHCWKPISTIVDSVRITLERCPPELSADLVDRGLVLAGGGGAFAAVSIKLLSRKLVCLSMLRKIR